MIHISEAEATSDSASRLAQVPMSEMLTYASGLTSMTQGRGSFSMEFSHFDVVPSQIAEKIVAAAKAERAGEEVEQEA